MKLKLILTSFFNKVASFLDSYARARAASELASYGHVAAANRLINGKNII